MRKFSLIFLLPLLVLLPFALSPALPVYGQAPAPTGAAPQGSEPSADEVNEIASQLYCPVCENIPLDVCPTTACAQWREQIRVQLSEGKTKQEIIDSFILEYGDRVVAAPPVQGVTLNWLIYIVPPLAILAGVFILFRAFKTWQKPVQAAGDPEQPAAPDDEYIRRLEEELRKH